MSEPATPEERAQHAVRLKMADDKWAALVADEHYEDAADIHKWYWTVGFTHGLREAQAEIDKLREAICRLADQDATLSVCDGNVTVTVDATLTDAEREAIYGVLAGQNHLVIHDVWSEEWRKDCDTLRGLLERTKRGER